MAGGTNARGSRRPTRTASVVVPFPRGVSDARLDLARFVPSGRSILLAFAIVLMMIAAQQLLTSGAVELATSLFGEGVVEEWIASVLTELAVSPLWALSAVTLFLGLRDYPSRAQTASA